MKQKTLNLEDEDLVVTAKFLIKRSELESFKERLKRAKVYWIEINKGRYEKNVLS